MQSKQKIRAVFDHSNDFIGLLAPLILPLVYPRIF